MDIDQARRRRLRWLASALFIVSFLLLAFRPEATAVSTPTASQSTSIINNTATINLIALLYLFWLILLRITQFSLIALTLITIAIPNRTMKQLIKLTILYTALIAPTHPYMFISFAFSASLLISMALMIRPKKNLCPISNCMVEKDRGQVYRQIIGNYEYNNGKIKSIVELPIPFDPSFLLVDFDNKRRVLYQSCSIDDLPNHITNRLITNSL